jgi:hypothetical protein
MEKKSTITASTVEQYVGSPSQSYTRDTFSANLAVNHSLDPRKETRKMSADSSALTE